VAGEFLESEHAGFPEVFLTQKEHDHGGHRGEVVVPAELRNRIELHLYERHAWEADRKQFPYLRLKRDADAGRAPRPPSSCRCATILRPTCG